MNILKSTRHMVTLAMLASISVMLVGLIHFPIIPSAPFLEYDPADIPIFIGTFIFGPLCGIIITAIVCITRLNSKCPKWTLWCYNALYSNR